MRLTKELKIFTNPKELRRIADEMEEDNKKLLIGADVTKHYFGTEYNELVYLMWDQER